MSGWRVEPTTDERNAHTRLRPDPVVGKGRLERIAMGRLEEEEAVLGKPKKSLATTMNRCFYQDEYPDSRYAVGRQNPTATVEINNRYGALCAF